MIIDKSLIIKELSFKIENELKKVKEATDSVKSYNQSDELKQESKYDTRAIEAGYLAGAQNKRVEELKQELQMIEDLDIRKFDQEDDVSIGAIVELECNNKSQLYFVSSTSGGSILNIQHNSILVISVFSPIGQEMLHLKVGDEFEVDVPSGTKHYRICSIQ